MSTFHARAVRALVTGMVLALVGCVDERSARIVALDLTGADWLIDRGHASDVLNRGFDATTASNASALLGTIFVSALIAPLEATAVVPLLIRPSTVRGQTLLLFGPVS